MMNVDKARISSLEKTWDGLDYKYYLKIIIPKIPQDYIITHRNVMKIGMGDKEMIIYQILNGEALHCDAAAQTGIPSFQIQITPCSLKSDSKHEDTFPGNA